MDSSNAPVPRVKLDDLPTDLKQRIVQLCAEQDARYKEMVAALSSRTSSGGHDCLEPEDLARLAVRNWPTVGVVFRLNRAWSELAAPYLFTVSALHSELSSKAAPDPPGPRCRDSRLREPTATSSATV